MERTCFSYSVNVKAMVLAGTHWSSFGLTKDTNVCLFVLVFIWLRFHPPPPYIFLFCDSFSEIKGGTLFDSSKLSYHPIINFFFFFVMQCKLKVKQIKVYLTGNALMCIISFNENVIFVYVIYISFIDVIFRRLYYVSFLGNNVYYKIISFYIFIISISLNKL